MSRQRIVTLTSIPPRFENLSRVLQSLLQQRLAADQIQVWIPAAFRRFPGWTGALPHLPPGVSLMRCLVDYGPATKILPALNHFAGRDVDLFLCDDDHLYHRDWLGQMAQAALAQPAAAIAAAGFDWVQAALPDTRLPRVQMTTTAERRLMQDSDLAQYLGRSPMVKHGGYCDVFHGFCGALVRADMLRLGLPAPPEVLWTVDDPWISGHLARSGTPIWVDANIPPPVVIAQSDSADPLMRAVLDGHDRKAANAAARLWFQTTHGVWPNTDPSPAKQ